LKEGALDLVVSSTRDAVMMVEAGASEVSEEIILGAIRVGHEANLEVIALQDEIVAEIGKPKRSVELPQADEGVRREVAKFLEGKLEEILAAVNKEERERSLGERREELLERLVSLSGAVNEDELQAEIAHVERLLDLARRAQMRPDAKMEALLDIIAQVCQREGNPTTKFLIFTEFIATQKALQQMLEGIGYRVAIINGKQKLDQRIGARQDFAADAQVLVSTDAGGEGIDPAAEFGPLVGAGEPAERGLADLGGGQVAVTHRLEERDCRGPGLRRRHGLRRGDRGESERDDACDDADHSW